MKRKKFFIRKRAFWNWVISYLFIMVIPMIFGVAIYVYALNTTKATVQTIYEHSINQARDNFDNTLGDLQRVSYTMASSAYKGGLSVQEFGRNSDYAIYASQLQKTVSSYKMANGMINEIFVYFPANDYILSSSTTYKYGAIAERSETFLGMGEEDFFKLGEASSDSALFIIEDSYGKSQLYYVYHGAQFRNKIIVFIPLDVKTVSAMMQIENTDAYLNVGDGLLLVSGSGVQEIPPEFLEANSWTDPVKYGGMLWRKINGESCTYFLITGIEEDTYLKEIHTMTWILVFYLIISAILGMCATWYFSRRNYIPLLRLLQTTGQDYRGDVSEFQMISDYYTSMMEKYQATQKQLRDESEAVFNSRFSKLIRNVDNTLMENEWRAIGKDGEAFLAGAYIMVGILVVHNDKNFKLGQFVVNNMFTELLESKYKVISGEVDGFLIFLVHLPDDDINEARIMEDIEHAIYNIEHFSHMKLTVNLSRISDNICMTGCCLDEIKSLQEYRDWMEKDDVKIRTASELFFPGEEAYDYVQNYHKCAQMHQCIREGKFEQVQEILQSILSEKEENKVSRKAVRKEQIVEEIADYIENHYDDWQLSGKLFAKRYQVSLSYLSQIFKKEKGIGLLDYINQIRYTKAKAMIENGITIQEAAQKVGYTTTQPLRRLFRQFEGTTPSQSKKKKE